MKFYKYIEILPAAPSEGSFQSGDVIAVRKGIAGSYRWETYKVSADGEKYPSSITLQEWTKLESISNNDISKLHGLKSQSEIDASIAAATANASSGLIETTSTVLKRGTDIPSYITGTGKTELLGGIGGTTYTNTGRSAPNDKIVIQEGYSAVAYYTKSTDTWSLGSSVALPSGKDGQGLLPIYSEEVIKPGFTGFLRNAQVRDSNNIVYISREDNNTAPLADSTKWTNATSLVLENASTIIPASKNKANPLRLKRGYYGITGAYVDSVNWICWYSNINPNTQYTVSGLAYLGTTVARLVFFTSTGVYISHILSNGNVQGGSVTFTTPANCYLISINLQNATNAGSDPQNSIFATTLQLELGDTATAYIPYQEEQKVIDYRKLGFKPDSNLPNMFYSYNKTGGTYSKGLFMVYVKRKTKPLYVGFQVEYFYDMSDTVYADIWRINSGSDYKYEDGQMKIVTTYGGLDLGESELVYKRTGSADFTGGTHGDEIKTSIDFIVNGKIIDLTVDVPLTEIGSFKYIQKSRTFTTMNAGETTITVHDPETNHVKITEFINNGYSTFNTINPIKTVNMYIYFGIVCVSRLNASYVINDAGNMTQVLADGVTNKLSGYGLKEFNYTNDNIGAIVRSYILDDPTMDKACYLMGHDMALPRIAFKYYRQTPTRDYLPSEIIKGRTDVIFL